MTETLKADYLVVGAGAMGMAFTDVLMTETDASVIMVDRHHAPGGHWNDAYPFVRLHQPSSFYGVNSRPLGNDTIDQDGWNAGLYELATRGEVSAYFDQVMREQFLASGRVRYFPNCNYESDGRFVSTVSGKTRSATAGKIVDATYMHVTVPSVTTPPYAVAEGVTCGPINALPALAHPNAHYVIIGAGKTGMDACLWLLANDADPDRISWVMPRDSWILDRANIQPNELANRTAGAFSAQFKAIAESTSIDDLFDRVNQSGGLLRIDESVRPTMYRCATVTTAELEQLRRVRNVIRQGRVQSIEPGVMHLDGGDVTVAPDTMFIDCSADGLEKRPVVPVFEGNHITLQTVRFCQQVFSAAFVAHAEAAYDDDEVKNELCTVVPHPDTEIDYLRTTLANLVTAVRWGQDAELMEWLRDARLDGFNQRDEPAADAPDLQVIAMQAVQKLQQYLTEAGEA